jgi:hypothetical protein
MTTTPSSKMKAPVAKPRFKITVAPPKPKLATRTVMVRMPDMPMRGGVDTIATLEIPWTGGDPYDTSINAPAANGCY